LVGLAILKKHRLRFSQFADLVEPGVLERINRSARHTATFPRRARRSLERTVNKYRVRDGCLFSPAQ
jgi:hypothetical protein